MVVNILLYHFNNYYNRKLIVYDDLVDYGTPLHVLPNVQNFNPGDGVSTSHVINHINIDIDTVDYALVVANNIIISRWFVLDGQYTRNGQTILTLYRDSVAEKHTSIFNAPMFIEKATLPESSPYIYNAENISVNEIKTSETLLKDRTGCAWLVGYMARNPEDDTEKTITFDANLVPDATYSSINEYPFRSWLGVEHKRLDHYEMQARILARVPSQGSIPEMTRGFVMTYDERTGYWKNETGGFVRSNMTRTEIYMTLTDATSWVTHPQAIPTALNEVGKILKVGNQYVKITASNGAEKTYDYEVTQEHQVYSKALQEAYRMVPTGATVLESHITTKAVASEWATLWNPVTASSSYTVTMPKSADRYHLTDAPYDMFCMPYGDVHIKNTSGSHQFDLNMNSNITLSIAQGLKAAMSANIYDIQLLPYCPLTGYSVTNGVIDILNGDARAVTMVSTVQSTAVAPILWCTQSQSSLSIDYTFEVTNKKMSSVCDKLRFCSPNYAAVFEMNPAKNNGVVGVNVDYTYMPFTPYIHVAPVFSGLYGENFGDARGLICQGDFSITTYDDKWADYQLNNKNYLNVFNREVENMEVSNSIQRQQQLLNSISGAAGGAAAGAAAGSKLGPYGAIAGAAVGGVTGAVGGVMDYQNMIKMQEETLDFKKDLFGFSLDNIKALPNTIAKVTSITANNKLFPFVEYYTCTDDEKRAVANKIRYNGMSVGAIGTISEYVGNAWDYNSIYDRGYIKGKIIDVDALNCDYHMANAIAEELNKGIYMRGDT